MSVRVRCRCGQELHLRYGEWVYLLLGLVVLCMALNSLALLLIYLHLERIAEGNEPATRPEPSTTVESGQNDADRVESEPSAPGKKLKGERVRERNGRRKGAVSGSASDSSPEEAELSPDPGLRSERSQGPSVERPANSGSLDADNSVRLAGASGLDVVSGDAARTAEGQPLERASAVEVAVPSSLRGSFADEAPLVRLLLLEQAPGGLDWRLSFLLDEDRRLRRRALERIRSYNARVTATHEVFGSGRSQEWLKVVRDSLEHRADGQSLLRELARLFPYTPVQSAASDLAERRLPELLATTGRTGEAFLETAPVKPVRETARRIAESGLDCVLVLDVSQSMEGVLVEAMRQVARLWPILHWGVPGLRLGVVLYRDEVVAVHDFSVELEEQLARLEGVEAFGGGDVPEGLHLAVKESLRLGVFDWRSDAEKHLIVLGDAPPPYAEQQGLASLVRRARQQDNFHVHALGVHPEEGRESVPFFSELAEAGGGRARTVDPGQIGNEIFLCLQPESSVEVLAPLLAAADRLLSR